ncbi:MAG: N-acetylmuramoyl-L-alanine amidase [Thermoproteota archaeon]
MASQKKYDAGTFQSMQLALRNKLTGGNVKVGFTISTGESNYKSNRFGYWNLGAYLNGLQIKQGENLEVELQLTPDGWNKDDWGGDDPSYWGEEVSENQIPEEMYRPAIITINIQDNKPQKVNISSPNLAFLNPDSDSRPSQISKRVWDQALSGTKPTILVLLQPIWIKSGNFSNRPKEIQSPTLIVVHQTGGSTISGAIHSFTNRESKTSAHYIIDIDGQIVKMVMNSKCAWHAGRSNWGKQKDVNSFSIGIEIVHDDGEDGNTPFRDEQYKALINLIKQIQARYNIPKYKVVGHSDVAIPKMAPKETESREGEKIPVKKVVWEMHNCPGPNFDWKRLEEEGLGLIPESYLIYPFEEEDFPIKRDLPLKGNQIGLFNEVKRALEKIGYYIPPESVSGYNFEVAQAIHKFKRHFYAGSRRPQDRPWWEVVDGDVIDHYDYTIIMWVANYVEALL